MAMENGKWRVVRGDCLWNIAKSVYGDPYRWRDIANANGISQSTALIYPGQLLTLPGKSANPPVPQPPVNVTRNVTFNWFALDAGTDRSMFATWSYDRSGTKNYEVKWEYDTGAGGWRVGNSGTVTEKQSSYSAPEDAKKVRITVTPKSDLWSDGIATSREYNYSNNPPELPPSPEFSIDNKNILTVVLNNIQDTINADTIEISIFQDDTFKYKTGTATIDKEARFAKFTMEVEAGHSYKVRCRAVRGTIVGGWTDFTDSEYSLPVAPSEITTLRSQTISQQQSKQYAVFAEWEEVPSAKNYIVQWTTNIELFETDQVNSQTTEEGKGPRLLITGIELGYEYYFRVGSINDKGQSLDWSEIKSVTVGTKPSAPTTYSNVTSCVIGEDLNLYWVHNSTDGSYESYARLNLVITDSAHPELEPMEITKVIENTKPEEDKYKTSVYTINTNDPDWATIGEGFVIKWKVQTAGVTSEYSNWSTVREAIVYAKPELEVGILNNQSIPVEEINSFPFYITVNASPKSQIPISYYVEIVSNGNYETVDDFGKVKMVNIGDKIYQKYYDPQINPWEFLLEMTPSLLDLEDEIEYQINVTVSMDSGLTAISSKTFKVLFEDLYYDVYADVIFNKETLEASIHPFCNQYVNNETGEPTPELVTDCLLSVYRRSYDGKFIEIAKDVPNEENLYVVDPHPALDYARYRIVAKTNDTGAISYCDIEPIYIGEKNAVIQWAEEWSTFEIGENGKGMVEPPWAGSMLKIPYNISISENKNIDVSLIEYIGREHPVSYYGTQLGETSTWSMVIPKEDKELLYSLRRLSVWKGDVYVREPYGSGYWANISISDSIKYNDLTVPITMSVTRIEGGM